MKLRNFLFIFCLAIILSTTIGHCWEFDNTKSYDSKDRSITVSNSFLQIIDLDAIAKVTPTTPHVNYAIRGKDRLVAEFTIESYLAYKEKVWDGMKFYNLNSKGNEIEREYHIRYKQLEPYDYYTNGESCKDTGEINKTDGKPIWDCEPMLVTNHGWHKVWKDLDLNADLPKGTLEIGIFADVLPNDNIEFVPTWFGVSMPEYSTWVDSFNTDLEAYWDFNSSDNILDPTTLNLTNNEGTPVYNDSSCLIGKCGQAMPSQNWKILANAVTNWKGDMTLNMWVRGVNDQANPFFLGSNNAVLTSAGWNTPTKIYFSDSWWGTTTETTYNIAANTWFMVTITRNDTLNGGTVAAYVNGTLVGSGSKSKVNNTQDNIIIGNHPNNLFDWHGQIDEMSYWSRTLSTSEITDLFNGGAGLTYTETVPQAFEVNVSLANYPNNTNFTTRPITLSFNSSSVVGVGNLTNATLNVWYTNSTIYKTNFSAITGLPDTSYLNLTSLIDADGKFKWNVEYCAQNDSNDVKCNMQTANNTFKVDTLFPLINITYPKNTSYDMIINATNFTAFDLAELGTCRFDNMTLNQTTSCSLNVTGNNSHEGNNKWIIWVNDSAGNINSSSVEFFVDSIYPLINFTAPTPANLTNTSNPNFTVAVNITDVNFKNVTFYLYNSTRNLVNETSYNTTPLFYGFESNTLEGWHSQDGAPAKAVALPCSSGARCFPTEGSYGVNLSTLNSGITRNFSKFKDIYFDVRTREGSGNYNITLTVNGIIYNSSLPDINGSLSYTSPTIIDNAIVKIYSTPCSSLCTYDDMFTIDNITINKDTIKYYNLLTGTYYYNVTAADVVNHRNSTETRSINIDTELPAVFVYEPKSMGLVYANQNVSINFSVIDKVGNLDSCWYNYNGTNFTIPCATNNTMLLNKPANLTLFANHTADGKYNTTVHYWNYTAFISNYSFTGITYSGFSEPFSINFTLNSSAFTGISILLSYNGTNYTMTSTDTGDDKGYSYMLSVPSSATEINRSFFYTFALTNSSGTTYLLTKQFNQTVKPFTIDNCSDNIKTILNMKMIDEESLLAINGTIEVNVHLYSMGTNSLINSYNATFIYDNNFSEWSSICSSNFSGSFKMAYTIRHYGNQSTYFKKFRVVQNQTISNQTTPVNLTLYNLLSADGYSFVIKARDYTPNSNLLVEAYRQYVGLDNYSLVESSITDIDGNTILHLQPSSINYRFIVSYEGKIISVFDNQEMICNNIATLDCQATLNLAGDINSISNYSSFGNIIGTFNFNTTSQIFTFSFVSSDGNPHTVNLYVVKSDAYGNTTIYNGTYTGTAGTLSTTIPPAFMNTTFMALLSSDGQAVGRTYFSNFPKQNWYGADIILELLMFSSLVLLLIAHPILIVIGALLGLVFSVSLILITDGSFSGIIASLVYFVIAGIIIIYQIGRRL